jgi:hypothetical protein
MKFRILFFVLVSLVSTKLLLVSCAKEKSVAPVIINQIVLTAECPDTVFYSTAIKPFVDNSCATTGCHAASSSAGGYDLSTYDKVSTNATSIVNSMKPGHTPAQMPIGTSSTNDTIIKLFNCWIGQGKLNN